MTARRSKPGQSKDPEQTRKYRSVLPVHLVHLLSHTHSMTRKKNAPCLEQIPWCAQKHMQVSEIITFEPHPSLITEKGSKAGFVLQTDSSVTVTRRKFNQVFVAVITTLEARTGRESQHMAGPSGDGQSCLVGPRSYLCSQQALLSKGHHCKDLPLSLPPRPALVSL